MKTPFIRTQQCVVCLRKTETYTMCIVSYMYVIAMLLVLHLTSRCVGIDSVSGSDMNVTDQVDDKLTNSTLWIRNGSSENCTSATNNVNNSSSLGENSTSIINVHACLQEEPLFPLQQYVSTVSLFIVGITIFLGVWSVVANSLPLAAIIKHEQLHTPVYILVANLAASDVLAGISFILGGSSQVHVVTTETVPSNFILRLRFSSILLSGTSSAYSLMALTAERYWFIVHGMSYVSNVTDGKCKVTIVVLWVWSLLLAMLPNFDQRCTDRFDDTCIPIGAGLSKQYVIVAVVFVFIPMATIFLFNLGIFWCLWKHVNAIAAQEAAVGAQPSVSRKSAITIVIITVVFLVGWMPFFVKLAQLSTDMVSVQYTMVLIIVNSAINPVIYGFRLKEVRRGVARLFVNY
ncbi:G-protein coupled receptor 3-like [Branchiostoma floridae]|uniref:G-protein coupled receptor 3-like n=1 Tax=Branchiostoma floridae TaxID=7739 RepID=A0A9J7KSL9_BRAFL|nr:G-protein coupled receptor 3-like [Branchiostoma floridae]